jgi:hypothetical protein
MCAVCTHWFFEQTGCRPRLQPSGEDAVQEPAAARFVLVEGPQHAAVGIAHDEIIAAAVAAVPPAAFDAFGAGENLVVFDCAALRFGQQPAGTVGEGGAVPVYRAGSRRP